jgi:hypothetical protein
MTGDDKSVSRFFGGLLMAVGGLIAVTSGLCSLTVAAMFVASVVQTPGDMPGLFAMVLGFGGVPFGIGLALFFWGRSLYGKRTGTSGAWPPDPRRPGGKPP